ncbi:MAG: hypothetical protein H7Z72_01705, partial [Bacteroidetes bacterium]|nr:hypothetical protein [Fibrella sp.]
MIRSIFLAILLLTALVRCKSSTDNTSVVPPATVPVIPAANLTLLADYQKNTGGRSLYIMQDGKVVFEQYDNGGSALQQQILASGTKSFNGIVAAAAITDGLITFDDLASLYLT